MRPKLESVRQRCVDYRNKHFPGTPIYDSLPEGWHKAKGTTTALAGTFWALRGPRFIQDGRGFWKRNPDFRHALVWDPNYC